MEFACLISRQAKKEIRNFYSKPQCFYLFERAKFIKTFFGRLEDVTLGFPMLAINIIFREIFLLQCKFE